ncbi:CBS domain-containing protein [Helicobacter himalayensis]|uniref:CBS domain-containing protein n=1 Tax=Helicobacter himalayensis TaxID=1591088 RepID=UPI00082B6AC0|nr:CBS domain-containing protein [Helicobacter himalayensis]
MKKLQILSQDTILKALQKIENNKFKVVFVIDLDNKMLGIVADGDIRRFIISCGKKFNPLAKVEQIIQKDFCAILESECNLEKLSEVFKIEKINIVPILDSQNKLINFITRDNFHTLLLHNANFSAKTKFKNLEKNKSEKEIFFRPWGFYKSVVLTRFMQLKVITIEAKQSISLQKHYKREEHWIVASGVGEMILENSYFLVRAGSYIYIPKGCKHRVTNIAKKSKLILCEVQLGSYFGEDDITRYEDKYNRS